MPNLVLNWNISHVKANDCPAKFTYLMCETLVSHIISHVREISGLRVKS